MTKEEIYETIGYNGKYNKEVKRKLRLLMKRFHPDRNKEDKDTIKVLVEVKNELANNRVSYKPNGKRKEPDKEEVKEETIEKDRDLFANLSLEDLIKKVDFLDLKIKKVEEDLIPLYKRLSKEEKYYEWLQNEYKNQKENLQQIKHSKEILKGSSTLEKILFCFFSIILLFFVFNRKWEFLLLSCFMALLFCFFLIKRKVRVNAYLNRLYDLEIDLLIASKDVEKQNDKVHDLKMKEGILKRNKQRLKDDVTFYSQIINKKQNKTHTYQKNKTSEYVKRK